MINHCVILGAINDIKMNWWNIIDHYVAVEQFVTDFTWRMSLSDCLFQQDEQNPITRSDLLYQSMLFNALYPFIILLIYSVPVMITKMRSGTTSLLRDRFISLLITTLWFIYPDLIQLLFNSFTCITLKDGSSRLFRDLEVVCWQNEHQWTVKYIGIPFILFYVVGIPLFFTYQLRKYKNLIKLIVEDSDENNKLSKQQKFMMKQIKMRYGLLFLGTKPQFYYWEVIILFRKLTVIFASNFLASVSAEVQCLCIIIVVIANMMFIINQRPFQSDLANYTNIFS